MQMTVLYEIVELAIQQEDLHDDISAAAAANSKEGIAVCCLLRVVTHAAPSTAAMEQRIRRFHLCVDVRKGNRA